MLLVRERAAKAAALPPEQRSADVADFVLYTSLLDEALELLRPTMGCPQAADPEEVSRGLVRALKAFNLFVDDAVHYQGWGWQRRLHMRAVLAAGSGQCVGSVRTAT